MEVRALCRCSHADEVAVLGAGKGSSHLIVCNGSCAGYLVVFAGVVVYRVADGAVELIACTVAVANIGKQIGKGAGVAAVHLEVCLAAALGICKGGAVGETAEQGVVVVRKAMVQVFKGDAVFYHMCSADAGAAQLEAVAVAVAAASAVLCPSVAECDTVADGNHADGAGCTLCVQIPAVIAVVVGHAAVKYIALAAGQLCCKAVCILHRCVITVVFCCAVEDGVVGRPLGNVRIGGVDPADLQSGVPVIDELAELQQIVAARKDHAVVAGTLDENAVPVPVAALHGYAPVGITQRHSGKVESYRSAGVCGNGLVCTLCTAVAFCNLNGGGEVVCAAQAVDCAAGLYGFNGLFHSHGVAHGAGCGSRAVGCAVNGIGNRIRYRCGGSRRSGYSRSLGYCGRHSRGSGARCNRGSIAHLAYAAGICQGIEQGVRTLS